MISSLTLRSGAKLGATVTTFVPSACTIVVGPNNGGKSLFLRELFDLLRGGLPRDSKIVAAVKPVPFSVEDIRQILLGRRSRPVESKPGLFSMSQPGPSSSQPLTMNFDPDRTPNEIFNDERRVFSQLLGWHTIWLDGRTRLSLLDSVEMTSPHEHPRTYLDFLFRDRKTLERLRAISYDSFGKYLVLDPTINPGHIHVKLTGERPPEGLEQRLDEDAVAFQSRATWAHQFSDGVLAFLGLTSVILSSDFRIFLIDEPEAFLHPPLARRLGTLLASLASERRGHVVVATHSADIVQGALQSGAETTVLRLTYDGVAGSSRVIDSIKLSSVFRDPLVRSSGALAGLFHEAVVICEGPVDRTLYQEINERLRLAGLKHVRDALFVTASDKSTVRRLVEPFRAFGVPAAAIVDLDILKKDDLAALCRAANMPEPLIVNVGQLKRHLATAFGQEDPKQVGISALKKDDADVANHLLDELAAFGVFVVPVGEVERWLLALGITGKGGGWLIRVLERMGSDPASPGYVQPAQGDVWLFLQRIAQWAADTERKGMA